MNGIRQREAAVILSTRWAYFRESPVEVLTGRVDILELHNTRHTMKPLAFTSFILLSPAASAQNLVPNPSFEDYTSCPDDLGQTDRVVDWFSIYGSPDYYNSCSDTFLVDVPANAFGYQAAQEGEGYMGGYTYKSGPTYREHVQAQLLTPLEPGELVHLAMSVAIGGFGTGGNHDVRLASRGIGMRFSTQALSPGLHLTNTPALFMDAVLVDTATWTTLTGTFVPDSAYAFVQLGNFLPDSLSEPTLLDSDGMTDGAYAFVDAICVSPSAGTCDTGTGVFGVHGPEEMLTALQANGELILTLDLRGANHTSLTLFDSIGRSCWSSEFNEDSILTQRLSLARFAPGLHFLAAVTSTGTQHTLKLLLSP